MLIEYKNLTTPEDLEILRAIAFQVWPATFADILSPEQIAYMMQMMYAPEVLSAELSANMHFEIICIDGVPSGYIAYSSTQTEGIAKLHKLYLHQDLHHLGIGQQMLNHVQDQCRKMNFKKVRLNVNKNNHRAIKAYQRNGFITIHAECNPIGSGFFMDDYVMEKTLKNS